MIERPPTFTTWQNGSIATTGVSVDDITCLSSRLSRISIDSTWPRRSIGISRALGSWMSMCVIYNPVPQSPAEKKSNDSKGLDSSLSAASMDSKADQRRLTVKALGSRGLPTLKLPNQRCQAQRFEIADFLFGRALT